MRTKCAHRAEEWPVDEAEPRQGVGVVGNPHTSQLCKHGKPNGGPLGVQEKGQRRSFINSALKLCGVLEINSSLF